MEQVKTKFGREEIIIETGKLAKQADGSVTVQYGGTMVLATAVCAKDARQDASFFPLTVEYQERTFAAGKIPGGFFKREGRPSEKAILTSRMIDRPIRPLFPKGMRNETQVVITVLSSDGKYDSDILGIIGASAALSISNIPFDGPIAASKVALVNDEFILFPTFEEVEKSELDLIVVANEKSVIMLEAGANIISEEKMIEAIKFGHEGVKSLIEVQKEFQTKVGQPKREDIVGQVVNEEIYNKIKEKAGSKVREIIQMPDKHQSSSERSLLIEELLSKEDSEDLDSVKAKIELAMEKLEKEIIKDLILNEKKRYDGRGFDEIRNLQSETNLLPGTHGSALFTRGQTQALAVTTLGTGSDEQIIDALEGETRRSFMLHYNFPPFSVGEARPLRGPGRREIGHGALAAKALQVVLPSNEEFPYTIRLVSEILESNGSSSMATVCAGSMALMASGVPTKAAVAGIAMGLITEGDKYEILTDIAGLEDHMGDMDFKVGGTKEGISAVQMDLKVKGVGYDILKDAFSKAKKARLAILEHMDQTISEPAKEMADSAPRIVTVHVPVDKIRDVIGPGGKMIRKIIAETGADINIEDDGTCQIASNNKESLEAAVAMVKLLTAEPEIGKVYDGTITRLMNFGAFCEIMPGREGLIHVSELSKEYVKDVKSVVKEGDKVKVKVIEIDEQRRVNLSIKQVEENKG